MIVLLKNSIKIEWNWEVAMSNYHDYNYLLIKAVRIDYEKEEDLKRYAKRNQLKRYDLWFISKNLLFLKIFW